MFTQASRQFCILDEGAETGLPAGLVCLLFLVTFDIRSHVCPLSCGFVLFPLHCQKVRVPMDQGWSVIEKVRTKTNQLHRN